VPAITEHAPRRAVFLDRDGVLNRRPPLHQYVTSPGRLRLLPNVAVALSGLRAPGYALVVVTNQQGVARGVMTREDLDAVHAELRRRLRLRGADVDATYACTHLADAGCACRKPRPGLLIQAARELRLSLADSVMIGDSPEDLEAGRAAGCRTVIYISRGDNRSTHADFTCRGLVQAARWLRDRHGMIQDRERAGR